MCPDGVIHMIERADAVVVGKYLPDRKVTSTFLVGKYCPA